jgi:hypothetical protein
MLKKCLAEYLIIQHSGSMATPRERVRGGGEIERVRKIQRERQRETQREPERVRESQRESERVRESQRE